MLDERDKHDAVTRRSARRAREFHRYLHPNHILIPESDSPLCQSPAIPNFSQTFAPHCQLTTFRCKARKAMVNLMDRDVMYFVSESTLRRESVDGEEHYQFVEDPILASCTATPLEGRICELTLHLNPRQDKRPPMFVVPDLSDSPFSHLSVVNGPPHYRFYAGTPIRTRQGVNIGSLAIMDDRPRHGLTREEEDFMAVTATQIMTCLESHRQAVEGNRARRMTAGLKAFFAGQSTTCPSPQSSLQNSQMAYRLPLPSLEASEEIDDPKTGSISLSATTSRSQILQRAASLIRECLDSANDTTVTFFGIRKNPLNTPDDKPSMLSHAHEPRWTRSSQRQPRSSARIAAKVASVDSSLASEAHTDSDGIDEAFLRSLAKKYPEGHLWNTDEDELSSSEDDAASSPLPVRSLDPKKMLRRYGREVEVQSVRAAFPSARQVLFAPLFDADSALTSYCLFVESTNEVHSFNASTDLPFLLTFCSSVTTEISKMEALLINKQKSDFVGTISHEMRSPLHGILGSAEFLAETDLTNFQQSLVKTIETCGKTLHDTISHVLEYSKINSLQKRSKTPNGEHLATLEQARFGDMSSFDDNTVKRISPISQAAADIDLATVLEEVVDSLVRDWSYTHNVDLTDISYVDGDTHDRLPNIRHSKECAIVHPEVLIDIEPLNWLFQTEPGAVRRIFMNVVGNALKFTRQGIITISLSLKHTSTENQVSIVVFKVVDTGSGISSNFLDSKLFLPFAQENALTPGTGLGLSIVHSIVKMLGGWIDVKSTPGEGTTVQVELPLKRSNLSHTPVDSSTHLLRPRVVRTTSNDSITAVGQKASKPTAAVYCARQDDIRSKILQGYVTGWCHFIISKTIENATVVIVDENDLEVFMQSLDQSLHQPKLLILCSELTRDGDLRNQHILRSSSVAFECITKPCGPQKLARALQAVLDNPETNGISRNPSSDEQVHDSSKESLLDSSSYKFTNGLASSNVDGSKPLGSTQYIPPVETSPTNGLRRPSLATPTPVSNITPSISDATHIQDKATAQHSSRKKKGTQTSTSLRDRSSSPPQTLEQGSQQQRKTVTAPTVRPTGVTNRHNTIFDAPSHQELVSSQQQQPRVLLVDDNKVNLRLLETYLRKKRQYTDLTKAEDGQQAVDAFIRYSSLTPSNSRNSFDLIFMDISMPVLDGFAATRAIRQHEAMFTFSPSHSYKDPSRGQDQRPTGAFIIAMTGLASAKDRAEGQESGCDVYMTKPVSFKEVSKLLDEWEASRQVSSSSSPSPSSTVTAEYGLEASVVPVSVEL